MAIAAGHRFPINFDELFPQGFFVLKVERAQEFSEGKSPRPAVDKLSGTPFRPAVFVGLKVSPYVRDGWVNHTIWAEEMLSPQDVAKVRRGGGKVDGSAGAPSAAA
ncbi:hypothetical protein Q5530_34920 [Saccharothrix sp. BKS2]|uniref:hypothetical protein n=1 Tax=Saccharothrix sp. BKS2 TaxID=3064400 RepID=UPI0039EA92B0